MKKLYLSVIALTLSYSGFTQETVKATRHMPAVGAVDLENHTGPQSGLEKPVRPFAKSNAENIPLGSSANIFTTLLNGQNQVSYEPETGALAFIHRQNASPSGTLVYDFSLDRGASWSVNQGPLTPEFQAGNAPFAGAGSRYPNTVVYNPEGNTNPSQAFVVGHGPALSDVTSAQWGNLFEVSSRLDGTSVSENYADVTGTLQSFHPYGLVSANGSVWSLSTTYNTDGDGTADTMIYRNFYLNRGDFDELSGSFTWTVAEMWEPNWYRTDITDNGNPDNYVSNWGINFSPDGQTGYAVIIGAEISQMGYDTIPKPVIYKTTNGGADWSKLPEFDFSGIQIFQDILAQPLNGGAVRPYFSDMDIAVDNEGRLHMFVEMLSGYNGLEADLTLIYAELTTQYLMHGWTSDGTDWQFNEISAIINSDDGMIGAVAVTKKPQIARSSDGTMMFFTWSEDDDQEAISFPDIMARAYSVTGDEYSEIINLTSGTDAEEFAFFPTLAPIAIDNGQEFDYELALVYCEPGGSDVEPAQFYFLRGVGFNYPYVSVEENRKTSDISVYPNPAIDVLTIQAPNSLQLQVELYDAMGKWQRSESLLGGRRNLSLGGLSSGVYYLRIDDGSSVSTTRFVKK